MRQNLFSIGLYLAALVGLIDQASKWWVLNVLKIDKGLIHIMPMLNLRLSWNRGVTFGLMSDLGDWAPYILVAVALCIMGLLMNWLRKTNDMREVIGLGLIMGGAGGNVLDRLRYGAVVDFIDLHYGSYHWYTFNVADSAICLGVACLLMANFKLSMKKR